LDFGVWVELESAVRSIDQADRCADPQFAAPSLIDLAAAHAGFKKVQLRLAHGSLEPEQQSIVKANRIVNTILIEDKRAGLTAEFEQPMPVSRVARQPGDLQAHNDARLGQRDLAHQLLEAVPRLSARSGFAEIAVDDVDAIGWPARGDGALTKCILALSAFAVLRNLPQCRLADIEIGVPPEVIGGDFKIGHGPTPRSG
jgi:hypothetical protein